MGRLKRLTVTVEMVTPTMAKELLKMNTMNRRINQPMVTKIANSIISGKYITTNMGVGIDRNGVLTDGQQRLSAIIKANIPVEIIIARNLDPRARLVVDTGSKRTHSNSLQMMGLGVEQIGKRTKDYTKLLSSVSAYIILHKTSRFNMIQAFGHVITNDEVVDFVNKNEIELMTSVKTVCEITKDCKYVQKPHLFFVYQMHKFFNKRRITQFMNILCGIENSDIPEKCPSTKLRVILQANAMKKTGTKLTTKDLLGLMIDASNKFMQNLEMKPNSKLTGRLNGVNIINVQITGEINEKAKNFFSAVNQPKKLTE
jgi:hypothetical protein